MATTTISNTAAIRAYFDAINAHALDEMRGYWTDSTTERFPDRTVTGIAELTAYFEALFDAVPDARMALQGTAEDGDTVFVRWRLTGTHTGAPYQGVAITGRPIELDGVDHFVMRDGRIESNFVVFDQMAVARAFGMLPPDGSTADRAVKAAFNGMLSLKKRVQR